MPRSGCRSKDGSRWLGRCHPVLRVTETGMRCAGPSFEAYRNLLLDGDGVEVGPKRKRKPQPPTRTSSRAGLGGQDLERGRPGVCVCGGGGGRPSGSPWWQNPPSSILSILNYLFRVGPRPVGSVTRSCACICVRVWEAGWGNVPLYLCGVLVGESRATWLAGAR